MAKRYCKIENCLNNSGFTDKNILLFHLPKDETLRGKWIDAIKSHQHFEASDTELNICERHFHNSELKRSHSRKKISHNAVPTIFPQL